MADNNDTNKSKDEENASDEVEVNELLIKKIGKILKIVLEENKSLKNYKEKLTDQKDLSFTSYNKPSLSVIDYLIRIATYSEAEDNTIILSLIYIDRITELSSIILTPYNIHRLVFTAVLIALKYNEDVCFGFNFYATVAGVSIKELKKLERDFIDLIKFKLYVKKEEFEKYKLYINDINVNDWNKYYEWKEWKSLYINNLKFAG